MYVFMVEWEEYLAADLDVFEIAFGRVSYHPMMDPARTRTHSTRIIVQK